MKLYRFLKRGIDDSEDLYLKMGWNNEFINLIEHQRISPSPHFGETYFTPSKQEKGTFKLEKEMSKYFFASLAETILYAENSLYKELMLGHKTEYAIMEIEVPDEIIKEYIGLGYYYPDNMYLEFCIPYDILYALIGKKEKAITEALKFYQANFTVQEKNTLRRAQTLKRKYQEKITKMQEEGIASFSMIDIYPLFCFSIKGQIKIIHFEGFQNSKQALDEYSQTACGLLVKRENSCKYERHIEDIASRIKHSHNSKQESDAKSELYNFSTPILNEENDEFKKVLRKNHDI